jgi:hypothetical protein
MPINFELHQGLSFGLTNCQTYSERNLVIEVALRNFKINKNQGSIEFFSESFKKEIISL